MSNAPKSLLREPVRPSADMKHPQLTSLAFRLPHSPQMVVPLQSAWEALDTVTAERDNLIILLKRAAVSLTEDSPPRTAAVAYLRKIGAFNPLRDKEG